MKINRKGMLRIVLEFDNYVIKIPNFMYSWKHFLQGLLSNIVENETWRYAKLLNENVEPQSYWGHTKKHEMLCPVKWSAYGGWILIMEKADVKRHELEVIELIKAEKEVYNYACFVNAGFGGDDKWSNYGYIENKLVKIDYGY